VRKIKQWIAEARTQRRVHSDDLEKIIRRCTLKFGHLFPAYICTKNGSRSVHHFNVPGTHPISLERVHGNREYVPPRYVEFILDGLDALVAYIELTTGDEEDDTTIDENDG
jgi:hypothetical protein